MRNAVQLQNRVAPRAKMNGIAVGNARFEVGVLIRRFASSSNRLIDED